MSAAALLLAVLPLPQAGLPDPVLPGRGDPALDVRHYGLDLTLWPPGRQVVGLARIRLRHLQGGARLSLDLHRALEVDAVAVDGRPARFRRPGDRLEVLLDPPAARGTELELTVRWHGELPRTASQGDPVGLLGDATGLVAYLEPDGAHNVYPCNDHPSDKATFAVRLRVPPGMLGVSLGRLVALPHLDPSSGLAVFAWRTDRPTATYLTALAAGRYTPIQRRVERPGHPDLPILDLAPPRDAERARRSLAPVVEMIPFLEERLGPFPFERYGHVLFGAWIGGLENQTLTVLGRMEGLSGDEDLLVHELAHQWFGDWVSPLQWRDLWLNEGWATWCELLWAEHRRGPAAARRHQRAWRRSVLRLARRGSSWTLAEPDPRHLFGSLVYERGGLVLQLLADWLGRDRFLAAARSWLAIHGGGSASTRDFQAAFEQATGEDLEPFFRAWVRTPGVPRIRVRMHVVPRKQGWQVVLQGHQVQEGPPFPLVLPVLVTGRDKEESRLLELRFAGATAQATATLPFAPVTHTPDPHEILPWLPAGKE